jgi:hypothetical protein
MVKVNKNCVGLDNVTRPILEEQALNSMFSTSMTTPTGNAIVSYLRSLTLEAVAGPEITDAHLRHLEGQRYIVGLIQRRINKGKSQNIVEDNK